MKAIIFNGALERRASSTSSLISSYLVERLEKFGVDASLFNLVDSGIPLFDISLVNTPKGVEVMNHIFREADMHFWLAPLYHGSIPGVMKNCLDWLELSAKEMRPYLSDKTIGLICWAGGAQAMQGINSMDMIAKSLRAWTIPFSVPIIKSELVDHTRVGEISAKYKAKLDLLVKLAATKKITTI